MATIQYFQKEGSKELAIYSYVLALSENFAYLILLGNKQRQNRRESAIVTFPRVPQTGPSSWPSEISLPDSPTPYHKSSSFHRTDAGKINYMYLEGNH